MTAVQRRGGLLRFVPPFTLALFLGPLFAGLLWTLGPAFGYLPALGGERLSLAPWQALFAYPGLGNAVGLSLGTGLTATLLSVAIVTALFAHWHDSRLIARLRRLIAPLLSVPHAALAFGLAFLIAPSGWLFRLFWAPLAGPVPPDLTIVQDPLGLALIGGLVLKEVPFLFLIMLAASGQTATAGQVAQARGFGYGKARAWCAVAFPQLYPQLRLPVFAVLTYAMSTVDMAIILGPATPPPLAVLLVRWFNDPDLAFRFQASAGAILQLLLVAGTVLLWLGAERVIVRAARRRLMAGRRGGTGRFGAMLSAGTAITVFGTATAGLATMALWAGAGRWRYPDPLPSDWSLDAAVRHGPALGGHVATTAGIAIAAAGAALVLALASLEAGQRRTTANANGGRGLVLLYLPLLVPQVAFLFGIQILLVQAGADGTWPAVAWSHLLFVLPYVFLALGGAYRDLDPRYFRTGLALGRSPAALFWRLRLPLLLRPILVAGAIGIAVSVGEYLPTLFAGAGRVTTVTTEAVGLAAGGDRRLIGLYAVVQMILPGLAFLAALIIPAWCFRRRRGMRTAA
ncbi:Inner membrane ABC transporter permease protein YnjC [Oceanibacterium hippocampi]|uniref:Inner membrane ABC transporter permease protein YnjC n=1 Tax=Oceanibacterium hippocampi TaxID=745714 RepID=A0A1Y5RUM0_9PROT|nr:Inner membrane ABC transporter permease protein YnjC [Oceanibacterium hippocampi]